MQCDLSDAAAEKNAAIHVIETLQRQLDTKEQESKTLVSRKEKELKRVSHTVEQLRSQLDLSLQTHSGTQTHLAKQLKAAKHGEHAKLAQLSLQHIGEASHLEIEVARAE